MKKTLLAFFLLLFSLGHHQTQAQDCPNKRVFKGVLRDDLGEPIPAASLLIKGTKEGIVTDIDGNYSLEVCLGQTVVISFIGYINQEVVIDEKNSSPLARTRKKVLTSPSGDSKYTQHDLPDLYPQHTNKQKVRLEDFLNQKPSTDSTSIPNKGKNLHRDGRTYSLKYQKKGKVPSFPSSRIKFNIKRKRNHYKVENGSNSNYMSNLSIHWDQHHQVGIIGRRPALQDQFSQGRSQNGELIWQGPTDNEVFSWGPAINTLEYNGIPTAYDNHGSLVPLFSGNGTYPIPHENINLSNSFTQHYAIGIAKRFKKKSFYHITHPHHLTFKYKFTNRSNIIIPTNNLQKHQLELFGESIPTERLIIKPTLIYHNTDNLPYQGGVLQNILASQLLTPVSFNNTNELSNSNAIDNPTSYELADGTPRSFAPSTFDNPFWLISKNPNQSTTQHFIGGSSFEYDMRNNITVWYTISHNRARQYNRFGMNPNSATNQNGRLTERTENTSQTQSELKINHITSIGWEFESDNSLIYTYRHDSRLLDREDGFGFDVNEVFDFPQANFTETTNIDQKRSSHLIHFKSKNNYKDIIQLNLDGNYYQSSTLNKGQFTGGISSRINFDQIRDLLPHRLNISLFGGYSQAIQESPF